DVDGSGRVVPRHHHANARVDDLGPELEGVDRCRAWTQALDLLAGAVVQRLARADGGAHRHQAHRGAVVAQVALHHEVHRRLHLGNAERAGEDAVVARDAARLPRRLHDAVLGALDGVRGTDLGAGRHVAVHADDRHRLRRQAAVDVIELDHGLSLVRVALATGLHAGLAADAPARVDEELEVLGDGHRLRPPLPGARGPRTP